jgi:hypothetical protein
VVSLDHGDGIPVRDEPAQCSEEGRMPSGNLPEFPRRLPGRRPQPIVLLVGAQCLALLQSLDGPQRPSFLRQHNHLQEIKQVAVDDQEPRAATEAGLPPDRLVITQEARKRIVEQKILQAAELAALGFTPFAQVQVAHDQ